MANGGQGHRILWNGNNRVLMGAARMELADDTYVAWGHARLRGTRYDGFIEKFVQAVKRTFPLALQQWEDFKQRNALRLWERIGGGFLRSMMIFRGP